MGQRRRYVLAGTGGRGLGMFGRPLVKTFTEHSELVGLFDHNPLRLKEVQKILETDVPLYTDFQEMLAKADPDGVIIASRDSTHAEFIIQTLEAGKMALSEKPVCVDAQQARDVMAALKKNARKGASCYVTHNMRYGPAITELKKLITAGEIGEVRSMNFHENLDRSHGADYFRRWHRQKKNSGGLLIHKASHHFDVLNWLADSIPDQLVAQGATLFYGKNGPFRHNRCEGCPHASKCDFYLDVFKNETHRRIYKEAEKADGYHRDGCVFDPIVDIEDQASVSYNYENGIHVTYSLTAFATFESMDIQIEGTKGRLELKEIYDKKLIEGRRDADGKHVLIYKPNQEIKYHAVPQVEGGHGGADTGLLFDFFGRPTGAPVTYRQAPLEQAVQSVLIGHAANVSIANGSKPVSVQDFLKADDSTRSTRRLASKSGRNTKRK